MKKSNETIGQAWMRELSLMAIDESNFVTFEQAQKAVLAINPKLALDGKALHFAVQGWMAAQQSVAAGA